MNYSLYFLRGSYLGVAHRTSAATAAVATATLLALFGGPREAELSAGLSTAIPPGSRLLGIHISSGTATVNFNTAYGTPGEPGSELARVAQVVYTLTQFPSISRVALEIQGSTPATFASGAVSLRNPLGRTDVLGALPAILVETPAVGDSLHGQLHLSGLANVFEAQFAVQLVDANGELLLDQPVHATAGTGTWGTFNVTFPIAVSTTVQCTLRVFDSSPKDGRPIDEVDVHIPVGP